MSQNNINCVQKRKEGQITDFMKVGVMGDGTVGKTTLILSYIHHEFITDYTPTVFDNYSAIEDVNDEVVSVTMWDLPGQDEYNLVRAKCYEQCNFDVIIMCFAVDLRDSFDNLQYKWMEEYKQYVPNSPLIVLGCKADLREDGNSEHVTKGEGEKFAKEIGAACYMECSATTPDTVSKVIKEAITIHFANRKKFYF